MQIPGHELLTNLQTGYLKRSRQPGCHKKRGEENKIMPDDVDVAWLLLILHREQPGFMSCLMATNTDDAPSDG